MSARAVAVIARDQHTGAGGAGESRIDIDSEGPIRRDRHGDVLPGWALDVPFPVERKRPSS